MLAGLTKKFQPMVMALENGRQKITTDSIKMKLLDMDSEATSSGMALAVKSSNARSKRIMQNNFDRSDKNKTLSKTLNMTCWHCKEKGHLRSQCPKLKQSRGDKGTDEQPRSRNLFHVVFSSGNFSREDWYIDSGASCHFTANEDWLQNKSNPTLSEILVANEEKLNVKCVGNVELQTLVDRQCINITIKDVMCVPGLMTNLLSVSRIIENGNTVKFKNGRCKIFNKINMLVATADQQDGVYKLNIPKKTSLLATSAVALASGQTWHRRLGHINTAYLNRMINGAVDGIECEGRTNFDLKNCVTCCGGKQCRLPFKNTDSRASSL